MRRLLPLGIALATASSTFLLGGATAAVPGSNVQAVSKPVATKFAFTSYGFGSREQGGKLPVNSDDATAFQKIACTNKAGLNKRNRVARATVPGLGVVHGVRTHVWTKKKGNTFSSYSTHSIAKIVLGQGSPLGSVQIRGLESMSRAFNKNGKYGVKFHTSLATIEFHPAGGGPVQTLDLPEPNAPIVIPDLVRIAIGGISKSVTRQGAQVSANVLDIKLFPSDTRVQVAQTAAKIGGTIKRGVFSGYSAGLTAKALADNLHVGRTPLSIMPCQGTGGKLEQKSTARVDLGGQIVVQGVRSEQIGTQGSKATFGSEIGRVARVSLFDGALIINGIVGRANVRRTGPGAFTRSNKGSHILELIGNGQSFELPPDGKLEIPGLLSLEGSVTKKIKNGIKVIGLQIKLFDGTGATIDLGVAKLRIKRSGLK